MLTRRQRSWRPCRRSHGSDLILKVRAVLEDLEFDPDRTAEFEAAMEDLGAS